MAIYHCSVRTFSRSDNHSAVAASAYRSGAVLKDERTGQSHNYRNRKGIVHASILLPPNAPQSFSDRLTLWNAAEAAEKKKNSRVAREVILALPHELSEEQRLSLTKDMALFLVAKYGVAVDMAVHAPLAHHGDDPRNHHAHLLFTTRVVKQDGLGAKTRILDDKELGPAQIELIRQIWETLANDALQQAGFPDALIDRRTLESQGIDRIPQEHVGKVAKHAEDTKETDPPDEVDENVQEETDDEEDQDGGTDTGQGKAGAGAAILPPPKKSPSKGSAKRKSRKARPYTFKARARLERNEKIKRLNTRRAEFSFTPLDIQLAGLNRHMDRLDKRVHGLEMLSTKAGLAGLILLLIISLIEAAASLFVMRTQDAAAHDLRAAARDTMQAWQKAMYGRTYRVPVSVRMEEMRQALDLLETRQAEHKLYKEFVELVERKVDGLRPTFILPSLPVKAAWRVITASVSTFAKTLIEAEQARKTIPIEYRPTIKQETIFKNFKTALANGVSPLALSLSTKTVKEIVTGEDSRKFDTSFAIAAAPPKYHAARAVWHKEVTVKIQSLDAIRAERAPILTREPMDSPKVWLVETNDRGRAILDRMQADIREQKAEIYKPNDSNFSGKFNNPSKIITEFDIIQKVRIEAKTARAKVPTDMRAEPYSTKEKTNLKTELLDVWNKSAQAELRNSMSSQFNLANHEVIRTLRNQSIQFKV